MRWGALDLGFQKVMPEGLAMYKTANGVGWDVTLNGISCVVCSVWGSTQCPASPGAHPRGAEKGRK